MLSSEVDNIDHLPFGIKRIMAYNMGHNMVDAIIFVPGLGRKKIAQQANTVARRFAGALDRQAGRGNLKIKVIELPEEEYGKIYTTPVCTIAVLEPGSDDPQPLVDLYEFDYRDNLDKRFNKRNPFFKALVMLSVIFAVLPRLILSTTREGKGLKDKLQVLTLGGAMIAVVAYMVIMVGAAVTTITQIPAIQELLNQGATQSTELVNKLSNKGKAGDSALVPGETADTSVATYGNDIKNKKEGSGDNSATAQETNKENDQKTGAKIHPFQALVVVFAALGLFQKKSFKETVSTVATEYVTASNYLRMANQKPIILGQAAALLEHIAEKKESYRNVHVVAYSFGTLVALDTLFPHVQPGARLSTVNSLVTIGCPFDVVRTYWPDYFTRRWNRQADLPAQWINLYAPLDVFGSNFRNDAERGAAEQGIGIGIKEREEIVLPTSNIAYDVGMQTAQLNVFDILTVKGIRIHSSYWTDDAAPEVNCFDNIATALYGDEPLLAGAQEETPENQALSS